MSSPAYTPVERKLGMTLAHMPWDPIPRALKRNRKRLGLTKPEVIFIEQLMELAGLGDTALATIRYLAWYCGEPKSTVYGYVRSLQRKGYLLVTHDATPWGGRGKTRLSLVPLKAILLELAVSERWERDQDEPIDMDAAPINSAPESGQVVRSVVPLDRAASTHGRDSVDSPESHEDPECFSPTIQIKALAKAHAKRLRVKPGAASRAFERRALDYVDRHRLSRQDFEKFGRAALADRAFAGPDRFFDGLDHYRELAAKGLSA